MNMLLVFQKPCYNFFLLLLKNHISFWKLPVILEWNIPVQSEIPEFKPSDLLFLQTMCSIEQYDAAECNSV